MLSEIPDDSTNIHIFSRDRVEEESTDTSAALLSVKKPEFNKCPMPDDIILEWLEKGWDNFKNDVEIKETLISNSLIRNNEAGANNQNIESISVADKDETINENIDSLNNNPQIIEKFEDSQERVEKYNKWIIVRQEWAKKQLLIDSVRSLFTELFGVYNDLNKESESIELIAANGFIQSANESNLYHPLITKRVRIVYDASDNRLTIEDTDLDSELYTTALQEINDIDVGLLNGYIEELDMNCYHPFDRNDTVNYLKRLCNALSSKSAFFEDENNENWSEFNQVAVSICPCFILRKRLDGSSKAINSIIDVVSEDETIPGPISDIVSGGTISVTDDYHEISIEEQLASVGGESVDVLLSKEANKEQLEIAKRIERYNAVLVQGPPGTGKTHTIANLMGHFLAQGQSVLVTSQTSKALSVLKEKIPRGLSNLCVSVIDDSNVDMERSINGITTYMASTTSFELNNEMQKCEAERKAVIDELAAVRKKLFTILNRENKCIVVNGEEISPVEAAKYVFDNSNTLSYIPGRVQMNCPLPLSMEELGDLYMSNSDISQSDEFELDNDLPTSDEMITPDEFDNLIGDISKITNEKNTICSKNGWNCERGSDNTKLYIVDSQSTEIALDYSCITQIMAVYDYCKSVEAFDEWMIYAIAAGKNLASKQMWERLVWLIGQTCDFSESHYSSFFGKTIHINTNTFDEIKDDVEKLKGVLEKKNRLSSFELHFYKSYQNAINNVTINGQNISSYSDCQLVLDYFHDKKLRKECAELWNVLMATHGVSQFCELDVERQELVAKNIVPTIIRCINWYNDEYPQIEKLLNNASMPLQFLYKSSALDSDLVKTQKIASAIKNEIPDLCELCRMFFAMDTIAKKKATSVVNLFKGKRKSSILCQNASHALEEDNATDYRQFYTNILALSEKLALQVKRSKYLDRLYSVAPEWANAIKNRVGIHGESFVPYSIFDAWKWKQYSEILEELQADPYEELQKKSLRLSAKYHDVTADYAEKSAWYKLMKRTEKDLTLRQALIGWGQTVRRIGKGTGKNASIYRAKARELMAKCQEAVPGWIMPIGRAIDSLDPKSNKFDIIIIDEASQANLSALAVLFMGKKLIIVGDDKQVSPMDVGTEIEKINNLKSLYIDEKIPNAHLYDGKMSIYDLAATTFQPLMLREHFRCMPEIIGFSNSLSYDNKIKPLRDPSNSVILPAVVNYRVLDGHRDGGVNENEAYSIVALMKACMELPEYSDKTMGVISLLGDDQVKLIQKLLLKNLDPIEINKRRILCGNPSHFQGDERDIVFLSMVDSNEDEGPLRLVTFGADDTTRKRYNVAASRARDQLWVVDSLDSSVDLKPGDLRKRLIEYSINPNSFEIQNEKIAQKAESPFEESVATLLTTKGYHIVPQLKVGGYRIDMVVKCGDKSVAIECDGEKYHSGEEAIRKDMERQTILERLGWSFIRIRGSEFYRDRDHTIEKVVAQLNNLNIYPETPDRIGENGRDTRLLNEVKRRAQIILNDMNHDNSIPTPSVLINNTIVSDKTLTHVEQILIG